MVEFPFGFCQRAALQNITLADDQLKALQFFYGVIDFKINFAVPSGFKPFFD